jgi:DNA-binding transcriptional MerR regulator
MSTNEHEIVLVNGRLNTVSLKDCYKMLEPGHPEQAARIRTTIPMIQNMLPEDREKVRQDCLQYLATGINTYVDTARHLLKARELKAHGMSDQEIEEFLKSWKTQNIF